MGRSREPADRHRRVVSAGLWLAVVLVGSASVLAAVRGPGMITGATAGGTPATAPPVAALVSFSAGTVTAAVPTGSGPVPGAATPGAVPATPDTAPETVLSQPISPITPVRVTVAHGRLREVTMTDTATGQPVPGTLTADGRSWQNGAALGYAGTYRVVARAVADDGVVVSHSAAVTTLRPARLTTASFLSFGDGAVGVGQPVVVRFSRTVTDRAAAAAALSVTSSPSQPGAWFWMSGTEAHYRPATYWQPGTTISLNAHLFGVDLGKGSFGKADSAATLRIHDGWVAQADGASKTMKVLHNGALVKTVPISLGSRDNPSHNGPHVISDKRPSYVMDSCTYGVCEGDPGYYKEKVDLDLRISGDGEFVHSAPWSVGQQGRRNVSHGCVNLSPANAKWFYDTFGIGDVVEITNAGGPGLPVWDTYGDWAMPWDQWRAGRPSS